MITSFKELIEGNTESEEKIIAVVAPNNLETLAVIAAAEEKKMGKFILIGDQTKIETVLQKHSLVVKASIIDERNTSLAAERAVELVHQKKAQAIMKGALHSAEFLKPILNTEKGLNIGKRVTSISLFEDDNKLRMVTDVAITVEPDLKTKKEIIENAVFLAHKLGNPKPKVAVLASLEVVNLKMQDTVDAAILSKMNDRGQIKGCVVDGPFAYDNAVSESVAKQKGLTGEVAGQADILLVPNLTVGNVLVKALVHTAKKTQISATIGAGVPLVFTSRTETLEGKLLAIALASYIS